MIRPLLYYIIPFLIILTGIVFIIIGALSKPIVPV